MDATIEEPGRAGMQAVARAVQAALAAGASPSELCVGRVVELRGLGGRRAGEAVLAGPTGVTAGSLLGGLADSLLTSASAAGLPLRLADVEVGDADAVSAGMACGGLARVLATSVAKVPPEAFAAMAEGRAVAMATLLPAAAASSAPAAGGGVADRAGVLAVVELPASREEAVHGSLGAPSLDAEAEILCRAILRTGRDGAEVRDVDGRVVVVEAHVPVPQVVVLGEGNLAAALVAQGRLLGWQVEVETVLDERVTAALTRLGPRDAAVVLSHDPAVDTPALAAALRSQGYVGALGSRHTQSMRRDRLAALGTGEQDLRRVHGPVGLDVGSRTPEETALAIVAEILAHRSGRDAKSLGASAGPING